MNWKGIGAVILILMLIVLAILRFTSSYEISNSNANNEILNYNSGDEGNNTGLDNTPENTNITYNTGLDNTPENTNIGNTESTIPLINLPVPESIDYFAKMLGKRCYSISNSSNIGSWSEGAFTLDECADKCRFDNDCKSFYYSDNKTCSLSHTCAENDMSQIAPNINSYVKSDYPLDYFSSHNEKECDADLGSWINYQYNLAECAEKCINDPNCLAFNYGIGKCNLSSSCAYKNATWSGSQDLYTKNYVAFDDFIIRHGKDCAHTKQYAPFELSAEQCANECRDDLNCNAFGYANNIGQCYTSESCTDTNMRESNDYDLYTKASFSQDDLSDEIPPQPPQDPVPNAPPALDNFTGYPNLRCNGSWESRSMENTVEDCAIRCRDDSECLGFDYAINSKLCEPSSICALASAGSDDSYMMYIKNDGPMDYFTLYPNISCGRDLGKWGGLGKSDGLTMGQCAQACLNNSTCSSFSVNNSGECTHQSACIPQLGSSYNNSDTFIKKDHPLYQFDFHENKYCYGSSDLGKVRRPVSLSACAKSCFDDPYCTSFMYENATFPNCEKSSTCTVDNAVDFSKFNLFTRRL